MRKYDTKQTYILGDRTSTGKSLAKATAFWLVAALILTYCRIAWAAESVLLPSPAPGQVEEEPTRPAPTDDLPASQPTPFTNPTQSDEVTPSSAPPSPLFPRATPVDDVNPPAVPTAVAIKKDTGDIVAQTSPAVQITSTIAQQGLSNGETLFTGLGGVPNPLSARYLSPSFDRRLGFILGPAWVQPSLDVGAVFRTQRGGTGDGNYNDAYVTITPSIALLLGTPEAGHSLALRYQGVVSVGQTEGRGSYDQSLQVTGAYNFTRLTLGAGLQASQLSGSDQDFSGDNANRLLFAISGHAGYQYSEKTGVDFTLSVPLRLYEQGDSSEGINSQTFINYLYSPLTTVGVGLGLGTLVVEGKTQVFEQALFRLSYALSQKLSVDTTVGYEFRQTDEGTENTPIFRLGISWQPQDGTSIALSGERSVYNSAALSGSNYTTTSIALSASQRIGRYLEASTSIGYNDNSYESASDRSDYNRDGEYYLAQVGLAVRLGLKWRILLSASYSYLDSSGGLAPLKSGSISKTSQYGISTGNLHVVQGGLQVGYEF